MDRSLPSLPSLWESASVSQLIASRSVVLPFSRFGWCALVAHRVSATLGLAALALLLIGGSLWADEPGWTSWRGPHANGHSMATNLPTAWSAGDVAWKTALKGRGQSSPVFWGDRIFLTTALNDGRERVMLCLHRNDGRVLWEKTAWTGEPEPIHKMNSWASATCAVDAERVYAFFGRGGGMACYTHDGEKVWSKDLGKFDGPWGTGASPVLAGDLVIQNCDAEGEASIVGLDRKTGSEVWKTPRQAARGWSSPILLSIDGRDEVIVNGHFGPQGYDPKTGKELWFCKAFAGRGEPTVTPGPHGLLYVLNGLRGDVYAVKTGGSGTITSTHMAWHTPRKSGRDLPSPLLLKDQMLAMEMNGGILTGYDAATGTELWRERVGGNFSASPTAWKERAFFVAESGETAVIDPTASGDTKIVGRNKVDPPADEIFRAGAVPSEGQVFLRSDKALYCVGKRVK